MGNKLHMAEIIKKPQKFCQAGKTLAKLAMANLANFADNTTAGVPQNEVKKMILECEYSIINDESSCARMYVSCDVEYFNHLTELQPQRITTVLYYYRQPALIFSDFDRTFNLRSALFYERRGTWTMTLPVYLLATSTCRHLWSI